MEKAIKEFESQLKDLATKFYEQTGAKCVDINIRISPFEESHKIGLEFYGGENRDCQKAPGGCCHD